MPIRTRLTVKGTPIQDEIAAIEAINSMMLEAAEETRTQIEPGFLDEARYMPAQAKLPYDFETEKSRRWYFAAVNGRIPGVTIPTRNNRYARTGALADSFYVRVEAQGDTVQFVLGSESTIIKWVMGSFDRRRNYQVRGHARSGHQKIAETADFWIEAAEEIFLEKLPEIYANFDARQTNR